MLTWAINRAGFIVEEFLGRNPIVRGWLEGNKQPTLRQLEQFAKQVRVPFGFLLLDEPPATDLLIPYFRTLDGVGTQLPPEIRETVIRLQRRQDWLAEYLRETGAEPLPFVGSMRIENTPAEIAHAIGEGLGLSADWAQAFPNWTAALDGLAAATERAGVIVAFNGVVGNNTHRPIPVDLCRGLVLIDTYAPFLFVNNRDAKSAQLFTLAHELAHVWLGKTAAFDLAQVLPADDPLERLCNQAAAEFLVPARLMAEAWPENPAPEQLARRFKVSPIVIARRALDLGYWDRPTFFDFYNDYIAAWRHRQEESQSGGGDFMKTARKRLSPTFMRHVDRAVRENRLSHLDAYRLTGLKGETYRNFIELNKA